jgi:hypothetical protein
MVWNRDGAFCLFMKRLTRSRTSVNNLVLPLGGAFSIAVLFLSLCFQQSFCDIWILQCSRACFSPGSFKINDVYRAWVTTAKVGKATVTKPNGSLGPKLPHCSTLTPPKPGIKAGQKHPEEQHSFASTATQSSTLSTQVDHEVLSHRLYPRPRRYCFGRVSQRQRTAFSPLSVDS